MKQTFLGIIIGIVLSLIFFVLYGVFFSGSTPLQETQNQDIDTENTSLEEQENEEVTTMQQEKLPMEHLLEYKDDLVDSEKMNDFQEQSPYGFAAALYAIKNKQVDLWNTYWMSLYDTLDQKSFKREEYQEKIEEAFVQIGEDNLIMNDYISYMLDGAIYFSRDALSDKKDICSQKFKEFEGDTAPSDGVEYCISLSYVFEAIRKNDVSYCSQISYEPENTQLIKNCQLLF